MVEDEAAQRSQMYLCEVLDVYFFRHWLDQDDAAQRSQKYLCDVLDVGTGWLRLMPHREVKSICVMSWMWALAG